jgi:hypothetical protein
MFIALRYMPDRHSVRVQCNCDETCRSKRSEYLAAEHYKHAASPEQRHLSQVFDYPLNDSFSLGGTPLQEFESKKRSVMDRSIIYHLVR